MKFCQIPRKDSLMTTLVNKVDIIIISITGMVPRPTTLISTLTICSNNLRTIFSEIWKDIMLSISAVILLPTNTLAGAPSVLTIYLREMISSIWTLRLTSGKSVPWLNKQTNKVVILSPKESIIWSQHIPTVLNDSIIKNQKLKKEVKRKIPNDIGLPYHQMTFENRNKNSFSWWSNTQLWFTSRFNTKNCYMVAIKDDWKYTYNLYLYQNTDWENCINTFYSYNSFWIWAGTIFLAKIESFWFE